MTNADTGIFYDSLAEFELTCRDLSVATFPSRPYRACDVSSRGDATFHVVIEGASSVVRSMTTRFHAFSVFRLLELLAEAGFEECTRIDETVYQPILSARRPGAD